MSRSNYSDDIDNWALIRWRGAVASSIRGKRGQDFLKELVAALDAMPEKRLIAHELIEEGEVCALGSVFQARGIDVTNVDPEDTGTVADMLNISDPMAREIVDLNDDGYWLTPEERWQHMRDWAAKRIKS